MIFDLALSWLTGAGVILACILGLIVLGYIVRLITPIDKWDNPFKYPSWDLTFKEITASLAAGFIVAVVIVVPIVLGAAVLC